MKRIIAIICILTVAFSLAACGGLEGGQPEAEVISNNGIAAQQGDWIYFINGVMPAVASDATADTPRSRIYRMRADGTDIAAVTSKKAYNMHIFNDRIFYTSPTTENVILYCIGINGKNNKKLFTFNDGDFVEYGERGVAIANDNKIIYFDYETLEKNEYETGAVSGMRITENYLYYYAENALGLNRIVFSNGSTETICDDNGPIIYADDVYVYFISARIPYRLNANTLELTRISEALYQAAIMSIDNEVMISIASDEKMPGLFSQPIMNKAGEKVTEGGNKARKRLHVENISAYCLDKEHIYFVEESGDIYSMTFKGTEKTILGHINSVYDIDSVDIVGDKLFLFDSEESGHAYVTSTDGKSELSLVIKEA